MGIVIREAELPVDREILLTHLLRNREQAGNELRRDRFEWSYGSNPYGQPRAWLAVQEGSGRVVGTVAAFPRRVLVHGQAVVCWNSADTSIDREFRTLGVAIKLRRAVKDCADRGEMAFLYSHPIDGMRIVLEKIGHVVGGHLPRHVLVLRTDRFLRRLVGVRALASIAAGVANPLLRAWPGSLFPRRDVVVRRQAEPGFGVEYDQLFERMKSRYPVIAERDSRFLTWRFLQNPLHRELHVFRLETDGRLRGYAIVDRNGDGARLLDVLVEPDRALRRTLLAGLARWLRRQGVCTLAARATDHDPLTGTLRAFGFVRRDDTNSAIAVYTPPNSSYDAVLEDKNWLMTHADRDV